MRNESMNRIADRLAKVKARGEKYLICLLPLGDPDLESSHELMNLFLKSGADLVEVAMPSYDPRCDSRQIAQAGLRAFQSESDLVPYFEVLRQMRSDHPHEPLEFMFYSDILQKYGIREFVGEIISADVDAALLADSVLMPEKVLEELDMYLKPSGIPRIRFMPHPFDEKLLPDFRANAREFVILQSIADQGGHRPFVDPANRSLVQKLHSLNMTAAVTLGYGINSPERVREALKTGADGIIVGTVLVEMIHQGDYGVLGDFIRELKRATLLEK